jgi:hypothetical protein
VIGDAAEHLAQVGFGIEAVEFGAFNKGVDRGGALAAGIGAGEQTPTKEAKWRRTKWW